MNKPLTIALGTLLLALLLPLITITLSPVTTEWSAFWQMRAFLVNYSGVVCMITMSATTILSIKHWPIERWLGGLDKQYRLHKYLGITAVITAAIHWLSFLSDDLAMDNGYIPTTDAHYPFWTLFDSLGGTAQLIGEWGFYLAAGIVIVALIKRFSYRFFKSLHTALPYIYLLLVFHVIIFFESSFWLSPVGMVLALLMTLASLGCVITITGNNGKPKQHTAKLTTITPLSNGLALTLTAQQPFPHHKAGQFAFIQFDKKEGFHPFSIASNHQNPNEMRFVIKSNGDYTSTLQDTLVLDQEAIIEGPYGQFCFDDQAQQQVWVAGGIGIAPFLSAFENIKPNTKVDLFYTYPQADPVLLDKLVTKSKQYDVNLHLIDRQAQQRLTGEEVFKVIADKHHTSIWFCGPTSLTQDVKATLLKKGMKHTQFHQELFDFR